MTTNTFDLFKVAKLTTNTFDLFKVGKMASNIFDLFKVCKKTKFETNRTEFKTLLRVKELQLFRIRARIWF